jgi:hypothetical protein
MQRRVIITQNNERTDIQGLARILADKITGGDPVGYLRRIAEAEEGRAVKEG